MDYRIDARDAMDAFYGAGNWSYRTAPHVGSDLGAALNSAMSVQMVVYPRLDVLIPPTGPWLMTTPISTWNVTGHHIRGDGGPFGTTIHFDSTQNFFDIGYNGDLREGGLIENLNVNLEPGVQAGCFIRLAAPDETGAPCGYIFNRLRASCVDPLTSSWLYSIATSGMAKTSPQGIRGLVIRDSMFFCARQGGMWAAGIDQAVFDNLGFAVPSSPTGADILIGGGPTPQTRSNNIFVNGVVTVGNANIGNLTCIAGNMRSGGLTVDVGVQNAALFHSGPISGAPSSGFVTRF